VLISPNHAGELAIVIVLVLEIFSGVCALSTIAFIGLASVSKLRPDLDEEAGVDLELLLRTDDQFRRRREADLDLGGIIDGAAGRSVSAALQPKKIKVSRPKRANLIPSRLRRSALSP
jgi:hypothetical protein